ncbi:MAG: glutaredoxin 3 [Legionellaceae bacterium]|nr:glutaredoxin 3 [Legionellaceae bacterium]
MKKVLIYSTDTCPYCVMAKKLLQEKGLSYTEIRVDLDDEEREKMIERSGRRTVPQIFMDDTHIGGYDDLCAYFKTL